MPGSHPNNHYEKRGRAFVRERAGAEEKARDAHRLLAVGQKISNSGNTAKSRGLPLMHDHMPALSSDATTNPLASLPEEGEN
jgi:hypothetical protein